MSARPKAQTSEEQRFNLAFFRCKSDNEPKPRTLTWREFVEAFQNPVFRRQKDGRLFSPAVFIGLRAKANVECVSMLILDYDHYANLEDDQLVWQELGICFVVYTTHSHLRKTARNENAEQRFRIVIPLAVPIPAKDFPRLWRWAADKSRGKIDHSASDASRMYYMPSKASPNAEYVFKGISGSLLDWRTLGLPEITQVKSVQTQLDHTSN